MKIRFNPMKDDSRVLREIYSAFGKLQETMQAMEDGIVLGHTDTSVAFPGKPIMAFGINEW